MSTTDGKMNGMRHYYLYAKNHYQTSEDIIADLKKIHARVFWVPEECVRIGDIASVLLDETYKYLSKKDHEFKEFMTRLDPERFAWLHGTDMRPHHIRLIESCLITLMLTDVKDIDGSLGEADNSILPLSEERQAQLAEKRIEKWKEDLKNKGAEFQEAIQ